MHSVTTPMGSKVEDRQKRYRPTFIYNDRAQNCAFICAEGYNRSLQDRLLSMWEEILSSIPNGRGAKIYNTGPDVASAGIRGVFLIF